MSKIILQISDLIVPINAKDSSLQVKSQGLLIFGDTENSLKYSQKLSSIDGTWEAGIPLFEEKPLPRVCALQVFHSLTNDQSSWSSWFFPQ
jgi:hypothetical protein